MNHRLPSVRARVAATPCLAAATNISRIFSSTKTRQVLLTEKAAQKPLPNGYLGRRSPTPSAIAQDQMGSTPFRTDSLVVCTTLAGPIINRSSETALSAGLEQRMSCPSVQKDSARGPSQTIRDPGSEAVLSRLPSVSPRGVEDLLITLWVDALGQGPARGSALCLIHGQRADASAPSGI